MSAIGRHATDFLLSLSLTGEISMPVTQAVIETSLGNMTIELDGVKAPATVANFLAYVDEQFYDGTIFHRVISNFMVQGGGFEPGMKQKKTKSAIANESSNGLLNKRGTLAMARTSSPNSATSQFFINVKDNGFLDKAQAQDGVGYCVFGRVIEGLDVLDKIKSVATGKRAGHEDVPIKDVLIISLRRGK
jgi:peptidyl-prolyl cis-trans isomerase B (cyclophilin B)